MQAKYSNSVLEIPEAAEYHPGMSDLRAFREAKGLSQNELASFAGTSQPQINRLESGQRKLSKEWAERLAPHLGISPEQLLFGPPADLKRVPAGEEFGPDPDFDDGTKLVGSETGRRGVPADGIVQLDVTGGMGGGGITIVSDGVPGKSGMTFAAEHVRDYWRLPHEITAALGLRPGDIAIIPVQGDSMGDTLSEGDFVFIDTRHRLPSPDGLYAITDDFGGIIVKRLEVVSQPRAEDVLIRIISDNPKHQPKERFLTEMSIIGRVVRRFGVVG